MFTTGRIIFTILFIIVFAGAMVWSYRKEKRLHQIHFKKTYLILLALVVIFILLFLFVKFIKKT